MKGNNNYPAVEASEEVVVGDGVVENEGGSGLLGNSGLKHGEDPEGSGDTNGEEREQKTEITEAVGLGDEKGTREGHQHVAETQQQAHPSHVSQPPQPHCPLPLLLLRPLYLPTLS